MKRFYCCPHCDEVLNPSDKIILRGSSGTRKGLFLFSPKPGNYDVRIPPGFSLKRGDEVAFVCPICNKDLTSAKDREWATILFRSASGGTQGTVIFSKIYGKRATYFITEEEIRPYGEHAGSGGKF